MSDEAFIWIWVLTGWITTATALWDTLDDKDIGLSIVALFIIVIDGAIVGPFGFLVLAYTKSKGEV